MLLFVWFGLVFALFSFGAALVAFQSRKILQLPRAYPPVTVLKPLKGCDHGLGENLETFFLQRYPEYELLFSLADPADPARGVVEKLKAKYPWVNARLIIGEEPALNPKVGNLIRSYTQASYDLLLISDSNVRVDGRYIARTAAQMDDTVGVITSIVAGVSAQGVGGALEAVYLNTFYARGMSLAFLFGKPCVVGKSMMFRRSVADRFGGMNALRQYVAEDYTMGEEMLKLGLKVKLALDPIPQHIGMYSFTSFWQRHMRWGRIRKVHAPLAFFLEPLFSPLLASLAGAFAIQNAFGASADLSFSLLLFSFGTIDLLLSRKVSGEVAKDFAWAWLARELLSLPMWAAIAMGNTVQWRGHSLPIRFGGKISDEEMQWMLTPARQKLSSGEQPPARTKLKDTITTVIGGSGKPKAMLPEA